MELTTCQIGRFDKGVSRNKNQVKNPKSFLRKLGIFGIVSGISCKNIAPFKYLNCINTIFY